MSEKGSWGGEFHPELSPKEGDLIAQNHCTASGFAYTNLDFLLKQHDIDHVVIADMRDNTCIDKQQGMLWN
jgi:nicotinamidase-related amidase